jgi:hypothetical protein
VAVTLARRTNARITTIAAHWFSRGDNFRMFYRCELRARGEMTRRKRDDALDDEATEQAK